MGVRLDIQLEESATPGSIIKTSATNKAEYLAPGANGTVLTVVAGIPVYDKSLYYGSYEITGALGVLEYTIPYTTTATISHHHVDQIKNSVGGGYFADYISEAVPGVGIKIIYDVQPPVGQLIKFNYLVIK